MSISEQNNLHSIKLKPIISYPRNAETGKSYLMTIDVQLESPDIPWPYMEEEYTISFVLDTSPFFSYEPLGGHEPSIILHRFGGTYGPAEYLLTAAQKEVEKGKISITFVNGWGIPIASLSLECEIKGEVAADPDHEITIVRKEKQQYKQGGNEKLPVVRYEVATNSDPRANAELIETQLRLTGWIVCSYESLEAGTTQNLAVRSHPAFSDDYILLIGGELVGIVRVRPVGEPLAGTEEPISLISIQDQLLSSRIRILRQILPFIYEATGYETRFTNYLEPITRSREVFTFHQPTTLALWLKQAPSSTLITQNNLFKTLLQRLPQRPIAGLPEYQREIIASLEQSLARNDIKALIQLPDLGERESDNSSYPLKSGRTHIIISAIYRLLAFGGAQHILYLVNSVEQGIELQHAFLNYVVFYDGKKFTEHYDVQFLQDNRYNSEIPICIATIDTLYLAQANLSTHELPLIKTPLPIQYNSALPFETFDVIFADDLSHNTFQQWHPLLDYFDAFTIGLTSEAKGDILSFFNNNVIYQQLAALQISAEITNFDVCILCALPVEAEAFKRIVEQQCNVSFQEVYRQQGPTYAYYFTTIKNKQGEELKLLLSWLARYGPMETAIQLQSLLTEFRPRFAGMTGICAGDKRKVKIGDLIIAERAFMSDSGKFVLDKDGQQVQEYDTYKAASARDVLQFVRMFDLSNDLTDKLTPPLAIEHLSPEYHIAPMASSNAVRTDDPFDEVKVPARDQNEDILSDTLKDDPFDEVKVPVRGTIAIDMEGAAFYQTVEDFPGIRSLLVKGVSDYADDAKDDSYQVYAAELSALYMLSFIRSYVRSDLMPKLHKDVAPSYMGEEKRAPLAVPSQTEAVVQVPRADTINVFFSYARKDERARVELEKQLAMLRRHNKIAFLYSPAIIGGQNVENETARLMNQSQIILLLISPEYIASDVYDTEVTIAYSLYEAGLVRVIPILLRQTSDWEMDFFSKFQPLPKDKRPIYSRSSQDQDAAFYTVAEGIKEVVNQLS